LIFLITHIIITIIIIIIIMEVVQLYVAMECACKHWWWLASVCLCDCCVRQPRSLLACVWFVSCLLWLSPVLCLIYSPVLLTVSAGWQSQEHRTLGLQCVNVGPTGGKYTSVSWPDTSLVVMMPRVLSVVVLQRLSLLQYFNPLLSPSLLLWCIVTRSGT